MIKRFDDFINESEWWQNVDLQEIFDEINKAAFDGDMKPIELRWINTRGSGGHLKSARYMRDKVFIREEAKYIGISKFYKKSKDDLRNTLAHEMIHLWLLQQQIRDNGYHGYEFVHKMREVNKKGFNVTLKDDVSDKDIINNDELKSPVIALAYEDKTAGRKLFSFISQKMTDVERQAMIDKIMDAITYTSKINKHDYIVNFLFTTSSHIRKYSTTKKFKSAHTLKYYSDESVWTDIMKSKSITSYEISAGIIHKLNENNRFKIIKEDEDRVRISNDYGFVIVSATYPKYEFQEDLTETEFDDLGIGEDDIIGKLEHIEIMLENRGSGYARQLMTKAIATAKKKGWFPLYLNACPMGNDGLRLDALTKFYETFGFKVFKRQGGNNLMLLR